MANHIVKKGEFLAAIAKQYGFSDWNVIWDDPQNSDLKKKRKNPNVLYQGDKLFVPEKRNKEASASAGQRHKFQIKAQPLKLRLVLKGLDDKPLANTQCVLHVDGGQFELTSDGQGLIEQKISRSATVADLVIGGLDSPSQGVVPISIGQLDPVDTASGQTARLNNMGYFVGAPDADDSQAFRSAVEEFQCNNKLAVDGKCGPKTQAKLLELHGC